jgi:AAA+ superfamily predicted ATPase
MIKKRPTLPTGYSLAGLPPVAKVLYSDERCELYGLHKSDISQTTLMLIRHPDGSSDETSRLTDWWAIQPPQMITVLQMLDAEESPPNMDGAVLELHGHCLEDEDLREAEEGTLRRYFNLMLDLVNQGLAVGMYPDFKPSLTWLSVDDTAMCTLLPLGGPLPLEKDLVSLVASGFYRFATGIEVDQLTGGVPILTRWSKYGGEELSRIVGRCLTPVDPRTAITTLSALNKALGRMMAEASGPSEVPLVAPLSAQGTGLDKVAGMHDLKELLLREVVIPIRNPEPYRRYGLSIPNGILLYGPPGCGKTYIARQLAEELGHYFVEIIPSEVASSYIHQSVMKIRELFDAAAEQAPAVIFIDDLEALVPPRGELGGHQQYKAEEVNEFLAHLNACAEKKIFVIATTNLPAKIDPAVRRTGRLDKLIYVGPPDAEARREMLALHLEDRPVDANIDLTAIAASLEGYSAADLRLLVDEAARDAMRMNKDISTESFASATSRVPPSLPPEIEEQYRSIEQRGFTQVLD